MHHTGKLCWQSVGEDFNGTAWECADLNEQMPKESSGQNGYESHTCWIFIYHGKSASMNIRLFGMKFILLFLLCRLWFGGCMYLLSWGRGQRKYRLYEYNIYELPIVAWTLWNAIIVNSGLRKDTSNPVGIYLASPHHIEHVPHTCHNPASFIY